VEWVRTPGHGAFDTTSSGAGWKVELRVDRTVMDVERGPDPHWPERIRQIRDVVAGLPEVMAVAAMEETRKKPLNEKGV